MNINNLNKDIKKREDASWGRSIIHGYIARYSATKAYYPFRPYPKKWRRISILGSPHPPLPSPKRPMASACCLRENLNMKKTNIVSRILWAISRQNMLRRMSGFFYRSKTPVFLWRFLYNNCNGGNNFKLVLLYVSTKKVIYHMCHKSIDSVSLYHKN